MRFVIKNILLLCFVLAANFLSAQTGKYADPVKIPISLSGNFCELRANHFHGGIDIRTQQRIGIPIYSVADGFIYRIVVSPTGYGRAIYIEHDDGNSSVYAHLDRFRDDIEEYVKEEQYKRESFAIDLSLSSDVFRIAKEEFIAYSGNTGSSGGPHLHFEIRDSKTQDALNPLAFGFSVTDNVPPRMYSLVAYPVSENSHINGSTSKQTFQLTASGREYRLAGNQSISAAGDIAFALHVNDFYDNSPNICGIYTADLLVNGSSVFGYAFDRMPFSDTRYMNAHIDYEIAVTRRNRIHRLWRLPGNRLNIYHTDVNRGIITVEEGKNYQIEIVVTDIHENKSALNFTVNSDNRNITRTIPANVGFFTYDSENSFRTPFFELYAPEGAFYDDFYFRYDVGQRNSNIFSKAHVVHHETEPIHIPVRIRILSEQLPPNLIEKSFIGLINSGGGRSYIGGAYSAGWFEAEVRTFGTFAIMTDTIPPRIVPLSIRDNNTLTENNRIRFTISDNLSGIKSYRGTINGDWVLFDYDAKNRLLVYEFDEQRLEFGKSHRFKLEVTDNANNTAVYEATFRK